MKPITEENLTCDQSGTLEELLDLWQKQLFVNDPTLTDYRKLMQTNPALELFMGMSPCLSWIIDIRTQSFVFVSNNVEYLLGYSAGFFRKKGLSFLNELMHPEDKNAVWRRTVNLWKHLLLLPASLRATYRFNRKYRLCRASGSYISLLEQNSVLQTDSAGNITHILCVFSDVTDLIKTEGISVSGKIGASLNVTLKPTPAVEKKSGTKLSKRERQIVQLVAEGYSSKIIADRLFISYHTVNTHRRNIIEKTHTRNTSGLVQFAIQNRII